MNETNAMDFECADTARALELKDAIDAALLAHHANVTEAVMASLSMAGTTGYRFPAVRADLKRGLDAVLQELATWPDGPGTECIVHDVAAPTAQNTH